VGRARKREKTINTLDLNAVAPNKSFNLRFSPLLRRSEKRGLNWRYASDNYPEGVAHTSPGQSPGKSIPDEFSPVRAGHHNTGLIMSQSLSKILLHIVFSTKNRIDLIPVDRMKDLHAYLAGACRAYHSEAFRVGGTGNHIHIACTLPRTQTVSK
jgi:hypothetical protein